MNIVLDELEICFHPELQRTLVNNLLKFLTGLKLNEMMAINIILSTHSPFILSDMPECNVLMLEEGKKKTEKDKCFFPGLSRTPANAKFSANEWILDTQTRAFLEYLKTTVKIDAFANMSLTELKKIDTTIKRDSRFGDFASKESALYKNIYRAFVENGYEKNIKKDKFIEAVGIKVCPYCNRTFIQNVAVGKKSVVKGELDHFLSKEDYPYFAICKYNLVPSCPFCNHGKLNHNMPNLRSPYDLKDANRIKFRMTITGHGFP